MHGVAITKITDEGYACVPISDYWLSYGNLFKNLQAGPEEFEIFITNRTDKNGTKCYLKVDFSFNGRYEDLNYLIECCIAATGMQPSPEYMLKDGFDGTTVLHSKSFVPG